MTHRAFEGWEEYERRKIAATAAGSPEWARMPYSEAAMIADGKRFYFTGRACKRGHVSPRTFNRECTQCHITNARRRADAA